MEVQFADHECWICRVGFLKSASHFFMLKAHVYFIFGFASRRLTDPYLVGIAVLVDHEAELPSVELPY